METSNPLEEPEMSKITVRLPLALHRALRVESAHTGRDIQDLVVEALCKRGNGHAPEHDTGGGGTD